MLKGRVDGKGKKKGKRQSLLGGNGDEVVDDANESTFMEDGLSSMGERGVSVTKEAVQSLTLTPTLIRKPIVRCRFHDRVVTYKVCRIPLSPNP